MQGRYQVKPPFPFVPGGELAGVVREVGEGVRGFAPGDRVLSAGTTGAFAERAAVPARSAYALPESMSFEEGAALPIVYPTSYAALVHRADLRAGETLLVHAAAGGVGLAAVQIGRALGARVLATAGGKEKCDVALRHVVQARPAAADAEGRTRQRHGTILTGKVVFKEDDLHGLHSTVTLLARFRGLSTLQPRRRAA